MSRTSKHESVRRQRAFGRINRYRFDLERQRERLQLMVTIVVLVGMLGALSIGMSSIMQPALVGDDAVGSAAVDGASADSTCSASAGIDLSAVRDPGRSVRSGPTSVVEDQTAIVCTGGFLWPVSNPHVVREFDAPAQPWAPGHRGVDLQAVPGTNLTAPAGGQIHFAGQVAGKSVVSIRHGTLISTFEPAHTELKKGTEVQAGQLFAQVGGGSDHCGTECIHWGLRRGLQEYIDPEQMVGNIEIVLKAL